MEEVATHKSSVVDNKDSVPGDPPEQLSVDQEGGDVDDDSPNPPSVPKSEQGRGSRRLRSRLNYYGNLVAT